MREKETKQHVYAYVDCVLSSLKKSHSSTIRNVHQFFFVS